MEKPLEIKFGTDGWRGVMARDFTFENVRRVAQAVADYLAEDAVKGKKHALRGPLFVGYDRRFQSDSFAREITRILRANRLNAVLLSEPLPTPALSFLTKKLKGLGVMVTASHNPPYYNGIKIKLDGRGALPELTTAVEAMLDKNPPAHGSEVKEASHRATYLSYLKSRVNVSAVRSRLKRPIVVDYLYGVGAGILEELVPSKNLVPLHARRDPLFGGINPEPIEQNLKELMETVKNNKAMMGLALDGDADRFALVDDEGRYLTPCQVFPMLIQYLVETKKIRGKIVQSVSLGFMSKRLAKAYGLEFEELPVGFKHVAEKLALGEAVIGGEESGGYAWKGALPERDGPLTALIFLEMCTSLKKTPSQLWKAIEGKHGKSCYKRIDTRIHRAIPDKQVYATKLAKKLPKKILGTAIKEVMTLDGLKVILEDDHWLLIRPSGTEPLLRIYAESDSDKRTGELLALAQKWTSSSTA